MLNQIIKVTLLSGGLMFITTMPTSAETVKAAAQLEDKLYRKALYFYFTGNYGEALNQINVNRQRFNRHSSRSRLFEAGLQVSVGLHHQATQSLQALQKSQEFTDEINAVDHDSQGGKSSTSPTELMLIALLQLAEQQVEQGNNKTARQTLSNITNVPNEYKEQYQLLNQLAYWPNIPAQSAIELAQSNNDEAMAGLSFSDAYIELNQALLYMEQGEFDQAKPLLTKIKNTRWLPPSKTFWQMLFNPTSDNQADDLNEKVNDDKIQQQAVNDYAQLLLAQMYVKQEQYEAAYYELKDFPQNSPYSESALFIFAFSAQKIKQYTMSRKLFYLIKERFPYSNLGWQSSLLLSGQVVEQMSLSEGMTSYQNAERGYQQKLTELAHFQQLFAASDNVLNFSPRKEIKDKLEGHSEVGVDATMPFFINNTYSTDSIWLQKALLDNELQADFQVLVELGLIKKHLREQLQKNSWLKGTQALNKKRKAKIADVQQQTSFRSIIAQLTDKQKHFEKIVDEAQAKQQGFVFANQAQEEWLERIKVSKQVITSISGSRNVAEYKKRIKRVEGVLNWQLQQSFPERLWQHKKQLKKIDQLLAHAEQQNNHFLALTDSASLLTGLSARIEQSSADIKIQLSKVTKLRVKTSKKIQNKVQLFVENQQGILEQHLLTARHEMAAVLERMAKLDKRIERQLSPSTKKARVEKVKFDDASKASFLSESQQKETL